MYILDIEFGTVKVLHKLVCSERKRYGSNQGFEVPKILTRVCVPDPHSVVS